MSPRRSDPQTLLAICEQGLALHRAGQLAEAAERYSVVLRQDPKHPGALHLLGAVHLQTEQIAQALPLLQKAVKANPSFAPPRVHLALACFKSGRLDEAATHYRSAIALQPAHIGARNGLGVVLGDLGRHDEALASHDAAIGLAPRDAESHFNRALQLHHLRRHDEALESLDRAIALKPDDARAHHNRGTALVALERRDEALPAYDRALLLKPDYAEAYNNRGLLLVAQRRFAAALADFDRAIQADPAYGEARFNRSLALLTTGDLERGFKEYRCRRDLPRFRTQATSTPYPAWNGEDLAGKSILVLCEQGFGDNLHFIRYAPRLAQRAGRVAVLVHPALADLFRSIPGIEILTSCEGATFDYHVMLMCLPGLLGATLETLPARTPYLQADPGKTQQWADRLGARDSRKKVGLVWAGESRKHSPDDYAVDRRRSLSLASFAPLANAGGVAFVSLQKGEPAEQARTPPPGLAIADMTDELADFGDTAALVMNLDLVITVDTSVAHLAGALGKPVWILSRYDGCWRWLDHRPDSPWYPTARLFHQAEPGAWAQVIDAVAADFRTFCAA